MFATQFVPHFTNLSKLDLIAKSSSLELDLLPLSSSLPHLTDLYLQSYTLENIESLKTCRYLSSLHFSCCKGLELSFLTKELCLPELCTFDIFDCGGLSTSSFAALAHAPNLRVLKLFAAFRFDNDCLWHLEKMVHLRKLELSFTDITGDSESLKTVIQKLIHLEELEFSQCAIGGQGAIAGALYTPHSRLRVLKLGSCKLVDDDLNGIGALKNTLEDLNLGFNGELTNEALVHCKDLVKLKKLNLLHCDGINDLSPLKYCLNLEDLDLESCTGLTDDSFRVFSEEPNSFPNLRVLDLSACRKLSEKAFEHLSKNNNLVHQLKELNATGMTKILVASTSSPIVRNHLCQLKGLRKLHGVIADDEYGWATKEEIKVMEELVRRLKNLEELK